MKLLLAFVALVAIAAAFTQPAEQEHDGLNRELTERERELQTSKTGCYSNVRVVKILAHECSWVPETNIFNLKVLFDLDLSVCGFGEADPFIAKQAFFLSQLNLHQKANIMPYSEDNPTCLLDTSAVDIFSKCADDQNGVASTADNYAVDPWQMYAQAIPEKTTLTAAELEDVNRPIATGNLNTLSWSYTDCRAEETAVKKCGDCGCCVEGEDYPDAQTNIVTSKYNCDFAWSGPFAESLNPRFAPILAPSSCTCSGTVDQSDFDEQNFYIVNVYNLLSTGVDAAGAATTVTTLSRWFETKLSSKIYKVVGAQTLEPATVFAVEIKDTPCDCSVVIEHKAQLDYIEERVFTAGGGMLVCDTPMDPACMVDYTADMPANVNYISAPSFDATAYGAPVDWLKLRWGTKFATLSEVLLRVRLVGNSDRALDLTSLLYSYQATGSAGGSSVQKTLWKNAGTDLGTFTPSAAASFPSDQSGLAMLVFWDNRVGYKQINIAIPFLEIGDAKALSYSVMIRVCDIGTKTQADILLGNDWCDSSSYVEAGAFKGTRRVLRRRVLQDDAAAAAAAKPALMSMAGKSSGYCDFEKNPACYAEMQAEVSGTSAPVDNALESIEPAPAGGSGLIVGVAAVVVLSIAIGAGLVLYSNSQKGAGSQGNSSGGQQNQAPNQQVSQQV